MEALKPEDPDRIGPFVPLARIGAGGMGRVYLARSRGGRPVAVKVIRAEYADDPRFRVRFRREVEAARTVSGLYTAPVLDAGPEDDNPWLATAYIPGPSLQTVVREYGPLPERSARILGAGIAEALGAIHSAGLIHRDLKPSNVICGPDGPRVIDFGISHAVDGSSLTATGLVVGSPRYSSPEQCRVDATVVPASDVFALGGVLVYATTGMPPFGEGPDPVQLYLVVHEQPDLAAVPGELRGIVAACLAKDPNLRPSIDELLDGLLPPGVATSEDWLPTAVGTTMRSYAVTIASEGPAGADTTPTHDAAASARGPATPTVLGGVPVDRPARRDLAAPVPSASPAALTPTAASDGRSGPSGQPAGPGRRRLLTGVLGIGAMAASGGGAWWAATNKSKANAQGPVGNPGGTATSVSPTPSPSSSATPSATPTPSASGTPAATPTATPTTGNAGGLPKLKQVWDVPYDLTAGRDAIVRNGVIVGLSLASQASVPTIMGLTLGSDKVTWSIPLPNTVAPSLREVAGADGTTLYVRMSSRQIAAYRVTDGVQLWTQTVSTPDDSTVLGFQGTVLFLGFNPVPQSGNWALTAFDVSRRKVLWSIKPADLLTTLPLGLTPASTDVALSVPDAGSLIFASFQDSLGDTQLIKALDAATGRELWKVPFAKRGLAPGQVTTPTYTVAGGNVFMTDMPDGCIHTFTTAGTWKWTSPDPDANPVKTAPVAGFGDEVVVIGPTVYAKDGTTIRALSLATGKSIAGNRFDAPSGMTGGPVGFGNSVAVLTSTPTSPDAPMTVTALDGATGKPSASAGIKVDQAGTDVLVADQTTLYVLSSLKHVVAYQAADLPR